MLYNEQKFRRMVDRKNALSAAAQDITERQRESQRVLALLQGQENQWRSKGRSASLPKQLEIELAETREELERLNNAYERATQACDEHSGIVAKCEEFLRDHGVVIPEPTIYIRGSI